MSLVVVPCALCGNGIDTDAPRVVRDNDVYHTDCWMPKRVVVVAATPSIANLAVLIFKWFIASIPTILVVAIAWSFIAAQFR